MNLLFEQYWPWWLGASALCAIALGYWALIGTPLGVSGVLARVFHWPSERRAEKAESALSDPEALEAALLAATQARFGAEALAAAGAGPISPPSPTPVSVDCGASVSGSGSHIALSTHAAFLLSLVIGAALASLLSGRFELRFDLGPEFARLVGTGWKMPFALFGGGILVGFGTRMSGGCTSGHGLSGCSRFQPGSLLATAAFFGTGVLVSILLAGGIGR